MADFRSFYEIGQFIETATAEEAYRLGGAFNKAIEAVEDDRARKARADLRARIDADLELALNAGAKVETYFLSKAEHDLLAMVPSLFVPESQIARIGPPDATVKPDLLETSVGKIWMVTRKDA